MIKKEDLEVKRIELEQYQFLSRTHRSLHDQRRSIAMKLFISAITLQMLIAYALLKNDFELSKVSVWVLYMLFVVLSSWCLALIHNANDKNLKMAEEAEDKIRAVLDGKEYKPDANQNRFQKFFSWKWMKSHWSWGWMSGMMLFLAIACAAVITKKI